LSSAVRHSKYVFAFKKLLHHGNAARRAFNKVVEQQVRRQLNDFVKSGQQFPQLNGTQSIKDFSWSELVSQLTTSAPTFGAALRGSMPKKVIDDPEKFT